jgi:hypothetical protein
LHSPDPPDTTREARVEARLTEHTDTPPLPPAVEADFAPDGDAEPDEHLRDSVAAQELYARAAGEAESDERSAVGHFLRAAKLAEAAREWYLAGLSLRAAGDIFRTKEPPYDLQRALRLYRRAAAAFEACGHFDDARALGYLVHWLRMTKGRAVGVGRVQRAELFVFWLVTGFGVRPLRVLGTAAAVILGFAFYYWATGGVMTQQGDPVGGFADAAYLSGITFSTVGYGDYVPARAARPAAMVEAILGLFATGLFVVVLMNRLRR